MFGSAAGTLPGQTPIGETESFGHVGGAGAEFIGVRVIDQHPLGQGVGGEEHLVALWLADASCGHGIGEEIEIGGFEMPVGDSMHGESDFGAGLGCSPLVFAHAESREVRGQDETNSFGDALGGQLGHGILDERSGMLLAEHDPPPSGHGSFESGFERGSLGLGALGQR